MSEFHYGYPPNDYRCSCGHHFGVGEWTPEDRAAKLKRMRKNMPSLMNEHQNAFLDDFEMYHGTVKYTLQEVGISKGKFDKNDKGNPIIGAVYDHTSDMFRKKAA